MLVCRKWMGWVQLLPFTVEAVYNMGNRPDTSKTQRVSDFMHDNRFLAERGFHCFWETAYRTVLRIMATRQANRGMAGAKLPLCRKEVRMRDTIEIRWHGRGGQGAKTAALLLADVAFKTGKYVQGFPEYGPERMGAPITAYNRLSDKPITIHSNIYEPDLVAVVDDSLLETIDVTHGLGPEGAVIVNSQRSKEEIVSHLGGFRGRVYVIDAREISVQALGKYFPNSPMLAAVVAVSGVMEPQVFLQEMRASYQHKFAKKPEVIEGNMKALELTFEALQ